MNDDLGSGLPLDPDIEVEESPPGVARPVHLRVGFLALAFVGGVAGTAAREGVGLAIGPLGNFPLATFAVNICGAFLLGLLLEALLRRGPDHGSRRRIRLLVGTGFMGGFTTYSALAVESATLLNSDSIGLGLLYPIATVLVGSLATFFGIALATIVTRDKQAGRAK